MVVTKTSKRIAWLTVIAINIYFVYFSVLRGITRSASWQMDYVLVCIAELLVEVILYETVECLWIHFMLPSLVSEDVTTTMKTVKQSIDLAFENAEAVAPLNTPKFFFPSHQLAALYPKLFESSIVLAFHSYFPPPELDVKLYEEQQNKEVVWKDYVPVTGSVSKKRFIIATVLKWLNISVVVLSVFQHLGTTPIRIQKVVVHTLQPIVLSFIAILYFYFMDHPEMILIPVSFVVIQVLVYVCRPAQDRHAREQKPTSAMNDLTLNRHAGNFRGVKSSNETGTVTGALGMVKAVQVNPFHNRVMSCNNNGSGSDAENIVSVVESVDTEEHRDEIDAAVHPVPLKHNRDTPSNMIIDSIRRQGDTCDNGKISSTSLSKEVGRSERIDMVGNVEHSLIDSSDSDGDCSSSESSCSSDSDSGSDSESDSGGNTVIYPRGFSEKKLNLLQWKVSRASCAVRDYCLANNLKKPDDYEFYWSESSDEYKYFYQPNITPFINSHGEKVTMYHIISKRNAMMLEDYASFERNSELAMKGLERRMKAVLEWDMHRLYESKSVLPFIDHTGRKFSVNDIVTKRAQERNESNSSNLSAGVRVQKKLHALQHKQQIAEYQLMLHTEVRAMFPSSSHMSLHTEKSTSSKNFATGDKASTLMEVTVADTHVESSTNEGYVSTQANLTGAVDRKASAGIGLINRDEMIRRDEAVKKTTKDSTDADFMEKWSFGTKGMKEADSSKVEDYKRNLQLRNAGNIFISKYQDSLESDNNVLNIETDDSRHYDTRHAKRTELRSAGNSFVNRYEDVMECDDIDNTNLVEEELLDGNESNDPSSWRSSNDLLKKYEEKIRNMNFSQFSSSDYSDSEEVE
jgi:hypothetical protein